MVKITINVDDDLWRLFSLIVMRERGRGKRNEVIVELIKDYVERSSLPTNEEQLEYILQIEEERKAFLKIKGKLAKDPQYCGKYVAIFKGAIVGCDEDKRRLAENVYKKYGYVPIYIDKVAPGERVVEAPSPELK
ncbi:MAG: hypothetical protein LM601_10945 [Candidatus Verstraetearchaeota archaeon]|jgi:hypothetical protein|nr:hypothetical protein [Candidatus Verstraetearchaeota archaeon]